MPKFSQESIDKLKTCDLRLQRVFFRVIEEWDCKILEGHRGKDAQDLAVATGKSKTPWPTGKHNSMPSKAIDAVPYPVDFKETAANMRRFAAFAGFVIGIASSMGIKLRWGGDWDGDHDMSDQNFNDMPHFEVME